MKTLGKRIQIAGILLALSAATCAQTGLTGLWKYTSPEGEMTMQVNENTILINGQSFPYQVKDNTMYINEGYKITPYPYRISGNKLSMVFPGGMNIEFMRNESVSSPAQQLPQSMARPAAGNDQAAKKSFPSGRWVFSNEQGRLILEFLNDSELSFNGETTSYKISNGIIQAMGEFNWIDYPYTMNQNILSITFPDGNVIPFTRDNPQSADKANEAPPATNQQTTEGGDVWQLQGAICSWSGSSSSYSSYSRTQKIVFDGRGNFQLGSESSFSSDAGMAYGGNQNVKRGTYKVRDMLVILYFQDATVNVFQVKTRQNSGMITEMMFNGTLFAKGLCED